MAKVEVCICLLILFAAIGTASANDIPCQGCLWSGNHVQENNNTVKINAVFSPFAPEYIITGNEWRAWSEWGPSYYFPSNGNGSFGSGSFVINSVIDGVTIADFDNDSNLDFIIGDGITDSIILYKNNGTGNFTPVTIDSNVLAGGDPYFYFSQFKAADFNGDGRMDFVAGGGLTSPDRQFVYLNNGNDTFTKIPIDVSWNQGAIFVKDVGDFDRDGKQDMLIGDTYGSILYNTITGNIYLYKGYGNGTFKPPVIVINLSHDHNQKDEFGLAVADFDSDGILDAVVGGDGTSGATPGEFWFYKGNGDGTFTPGASVFNLKGTGLGQAVIDAFDFDKDGKPDIVGMNGNGGQVIYIQGNGNGTFQTPVTIFEDSASLLGAGIAAPSDPLSPPPQPPTPPEPPTPPQQITPVPSLTLLGAVFLAGLLGVLAAISIKRRL